MSPRGNFFLNLFPGPPPPGDSSIASIRSRELVDGVAANTKICPDCDGFMSRPSMVLRRSRIERVLRVWVYT